MAVSAFSFQNSPAASEIIACMDMSARSRKIAETAAKYADWLGRPLVFFHAIDFDHANGQLPDPLEWHLRRGKAQQHLEDLRDAIGGPGPLASLEIKEGRWLDALSARLAVRPSPMVVIGASSHGNTGQTAGTLIDSGTGNLLVVPFGCTRTFSHSPRIAIPIDGSKYAEAALAEAINLAQGRAAELLLMHVMPHSGVELFGPPAISEIELQMRLDRHNEKVACSFLEQSLRRLRNLGIKARSLCLKGDPRSCLVQMLESEAPDLVMLSARGHGIKSCADLPVGSTAHYLLDHIKAPVMLAASRTLQTDTDMNNSARIRNERDARMPLNNSPVAA